MNLRLDNREEISCKMVFLKYGRIAIEAVGIPATFDMCQNIIRSGGTIYHASNRNRKHEYDPTSLESGALETARSRKTHYASIYTR